MTGESPGRSSKCCKRATVASRGSKLSSWSFLMRGMRVGHSELLQQNAKTGDSERHILCFPASTYKRADEKYWIRLRQRFLTDKNLYDQMKTLLHEQWHVFTGIIKQEYTKA